MQCGSARQSFTVPAGSGSYAPETIPLFGTGLGGKIQEVSMLVEALPATAVVELQLLRAGGDPTQPSHFVPAKSASVTGLVDLIAVAMWYGGRIMVKSGGTAGTATVSAHWN